MALLNLEKVLRQLRLYGAGFFDGAIRAQTANAKAVYQRSQLYVPVDTGALRATGRVTAELRELDKASVDIQYGGAGSTAEAYAVIVHEDPDAFHEPPTQYKYLERAVREIQPEMTLRIGQGAVAAAKRRSGVR